MNLFYLSKFWKVGTVAAFGGLTLASVSHRAEAQTLGTQSLPTFHHRVGVSTFQPSQPAPQNQPPSQPATQALPPSVINPPIFTPPTPPPVTSEQALAFLRLDLAHLVLKSPLTLKVENASLEKIAAQVQKSLTDSHVTPRVDIQVREPRPVLLSFAAKDSTVGEVLRSSGNLAGVQLWVFSDHFLLAAEKSLLPDEKKAVEEDRAFKSPTTTGDIMMTLQSQQAALSSFVANEIKGLGDKGAKGQSTQVTFAQLSPESKAMLQVLFDGAKDRWFLQGPGRNGMIESALASFNLSNNPTVSLTPTSRQGDDPGIQITFPNGNMGWSTSGRSSSISTQGPTPRSVAPARVVPPALDPSAGNS